MALSTATIKFCLCLCPALFVIFIFTLSLSNTAFTPICSILNTTLDVKRSQGNRNDLEEQLTHFKKMAETRRWAIKNEQNLASLQMYIVPQINCPTVVRVGAIGDGGKWVCNPWRVPETCVIYSLGVNGDTSFERDMYSITKEKCKIYSFDISPQSQSLFDSFKGIFRAWKIAATTNENFNEWAIVDIAKNFSHEKIDIMKMDIESFEFTALPPVLLSELVSNGKVCQVLVELHSTVSSWKSLQDQLEKTGFILFYKEANMYCPSCYEYSYIHKSCLEQYGLQNEVVFNNNFD